MNGKGKNDLERFKEYPQQITPPPGLDAPAARLTEELYGKKAAEKKERRRGWSGAAFSLRWRSSWYCSFRSVSAFRACSLWMTKRGTTIWGKM